jgi:hypothetical protein
LSVILVESRMQVEPFVMAVRRPCGGDRNSEREKPRRRD